MSLIEQINQGTIFARATETISVGSGIQGGNISAIEYGIVCLSISAQSPCRVRLYADSSSRVDDLSRTYGDTNLLPGTGLIVDVNLDTDTSLTFNPPVPGTTFNGGSVWYTVSGSQANEIELKYINIEGEFGERSSLILTGSSLITGSSGFGSNITAPNLFFILSGSTTVPSRVRLFSKPIEEISNTEIDRTFDTTPEANSYLIVDMLLETASVDYKMVPIQQAINLNSLEAGNNTYGYQIENISTTGTSDVTSSLYIYEIEA